MSFVCSLIWLAYVVGVVPYLVSFDAWLLVASFIQAPFSRGAPMYATVRAVRVEFWSM